MTDAGLSIPWLAAGLLTAGVVTTATPIAPSNYGLLWQLLGCGAGAITSLAVRPYQGMTRGQIALSLFAAFTFAFFLTPTFFGPMTYTREDGGWFYGMATGAFVLIPVLVKRFKLILAAAMGGESKPENEP